MVSKIPSATMPTTNNAKVTSLRRPRFFQPNKARPLSSNRLTWALFIFLLALFITAIRHVPKAAYAVPRGPPNTFSLPRNAPSTFTASVERPLDTNETMASDQGRPYAPVRRAQGSGKLALLEFPRRRDSKQSLDEPDQCKVWRKLARQPSKLQLYRNHFNSLDNTDWFLYTSVFGEKWHASKKRRPTYLDIAANHAKRWSASWFFDRCMGWDGVCAEPNDIYWDELRSQRHCQLIDTCLSDQVRKVNFSFTGAYGGVVADHAAQDEGRHFGVNGKLHSQSTKYEKHFNGIREIECTTVRNAMRERNDGEERMTHFDFMSLDVEGHEYPILQGIDWKTTTIDVIVTENRGIKVLQLLEREGYDHFPALLKDDVWVRNDSGIELDPKVQTWLKSLDRKTYQFGEDVKDDMSFAENKEDDRVADRQKDENIKAGQEVSEEKSVVKRNDSGAKSKDSGKATTHVVGGDT